MADLSAIMDALGAAVGTIADLRPHPYWADNVTPPAAIVAWPDSYEFDQTMARGSDHVTLPVIVVVGRADARTSRDRLAQYVAGSGAQSVKQAVENTTTTAYDSARVVKVEFGTLSIASISYLAATFDVDIYAHGGS